MMVVRSGRALSEGIIGQTGAWRRFRTGYLPWHRRSGCTNAACSEYAAWSPADGAVGHCPPWDKRLDDSGHILPWQNLLHAGEENLFSGLTALSAEFTIGEGELMAHDVPLGCAPDEYDDLYIRNLFAPSSGRIRSDICIQLLIKICKLAIQIENHESPRV